MFFKNQPLSQIISKDHKQARIDRTAWILGSLEFLKRQIKPKYCTNLILSLTPDSTKSFLLTAELLHDW